MATITTRSGKGSPLTNTEVDDNFTNLNTDKIESVVDDTSPQLGGNLSLNGNNITGNGNITLSDSQYIAIGASNDFIAGYTSGLNFSYIDSASSLYISSSSTLGLLKDGAPVGGSYEWMAKFTPDGSAELYYDNALKIATTSTGIDVTGEVQCDSLDVDTTDTGVVADIQSNNTSTTLSGPDIKLNRTGVFYGISNTPSGSIQFGSRMQYVDFTHSTIEAYKDSGQVSSYSGSLRFKNTDQANTTLIERMRMNQYGIVINEDGDAGTDFRVETDSKVNALFVDASANTVYMGASSLDAGALCTTASTVIAGTAASTSTAVLCVQDLDSTVSYNVIAEFNFANDTSFTRGYYNLFSDSGGFQGGIYGTGGGSVVYLTSSDERVKENIEDTGSKIDLIKSLQVRDYTRKSNGRAETGFIAQELNEHIPNAVGAGTDADENGDYIPWGVDYGAITPHLTKALQEAIAKIEALEARVAELEGSNNG